MKIKNHLDQEKINIQKIIQKLSQNSFYKIRDYLINKIDNNYEYNLDYDYERDNTGCSCDMICRCSKIINVEIKNVHCIEPYLNSIKRILNKRSINAKNNNLNEKEKEILFYMMNEIEKNELITYGVEKIALLNNILDTESYEAIIVNGYYGEEIESFIFNQHEQIIEEIFKLFLMNDNQKIEFLLEKEYGFLIDRCKNKNWIIEEIDIEVITQYNEEQIQNANHNLIINNYDNILDKKNPQLICTKKDNEEYALIDGYHRFINLKKSNDKEKKVKIILGQ